MSLLRDPSLAEYLGSRHAALGFMLFAFGLGALVVFAIVGVQYGVSGETDDLGVGTWLIPLWGAIAMPLGIYLRREMPALTTIIAGGIWLAIPVTAGLIMRF